MAIILCLRMAIACRNERNKIRRIHLQNEMNHQDDNLLFKNNLIPTAYIVF